MEDRIYISKEFRFEAAHNLPFHKGKCKSPHGHSYVGEITVSSTLLTNGMVMDYYDLKKIIDEEIVNVCDHADLNEVLKKYKAKKSIQGNELDLNSTAEDLVKWFSKKIELRLSTEFPNITLEKVLLKETNTSSAFILKRGDVA